MRGFNADMGQKDFFETGSNVRSQTTEADMFGNPSLMTRIAIGKVIGFLFGLAGFILYLTFSRMLAGCSVGESCCGTPRLAQLSACSVSLPITRY